MANKGWLTPKLKYRVEILEATQTPNEKGGYDRGYNVLTTIWAGIKELSGFFNQTAYIRGEQVENIETHAFIVRMIAVKNLGIGFDSAFGDGPDTIEDINPLKAEYFIRTREGSDPHIKGRLFRIKKIQRDNVYKAYFDIRVMEIEEQGTGYTE